MKIRRKNILVWTLQIIVSVLFLLFSFIKILPAASANEGYSKAIANNYFFAKDLKIKKDTSKLLRKKNNSVFGKYTKFSNDVVDLDSGKVIVCLFSLDCNHCQETNKILNELKKKYLNFPSVYILALGDESAVDNFFSFGGGKFPYLIISPNEFFPLLDKANYPPRLVVMDNGNLIGDFINFEKLDTVELMKTIAN